MTTIETFSAAIFAAILRVYFRYSAMKSRAKSKSHFFIILAVSLTISITAGILLAQPLTAWFGWSMASTPFVALLLALTAESLLEKVLNLSEAVQLQDYIKPSGYHHSYPYHSQIDSGDGEGNIDDPDNPKGTS